MILRTVKDQEIRELDSPKRTVEREFHSRVNFHNLCGYEQLRAERSNTSFQVISLKFSDPKTIQQNEAILTDAFKTRLRMIDEIGYLEENQLGIITPYTSATGARALASDLLLLLPESFSTPSVTLYKNQVESSESQGNDNQEKPIRELIGVTESDLAEVVPQSMPLWKRSLDVLCAVVGLTLLTLILVTIALLIKLSSKGPVIFAQQRTGKGGKPFWIYKFRSMVINAEEFRDELSALNEQDGPAFKIQNDPRITWIGHWIRSLSLDELPQLWNVLIGDMSFVGPRPLPCHEADQCLSWQRQRSMITPGITCVWQVQDRSVSIPFAEWMRMDIRYAKSMSLIHDFKLLFQTFFFLVGRRNR